MWPGTPQTLMGKTKSRREGNTWTPELPGVEVMGALVSLYFHICVFLSTTLPTWAPDFLPLGSWGYAKSSGAYRVLRSILVSTLAGLLHFPLETAFLSFLPENLI